MSGIEASQKPELQQKELFVDASQHISFPQAANEGANASGLSRPNIIDIKD